MSFAALITAGISAVIAKEVDAWKDRAKAKRISERMDPYGEGDGWNLFSKDDLKRNVAGDLGMIPVAGDFAAKAFEDATFKTYESGAPRDTGTWTQAGIGAATDLIKAVPMVGELGGQAAGEAAGSMIGELMSESLAQGAQAAQPALESVTPAMGVVAANLPAATPVAPGTWDAITSAVSEVADKGVGIAGQIQDAMDEPGQLIGEARDYVQEPLTELLGEGVGKQTFDTLASTGARSALGAATDPDNPGRGAAAGAFQGALGSLADLGLDQGIGDLGQSAGIDLQKALSGPVNQALSPIAQAGTGAIQQALTPQTFQPNYMQNPYAPTGLWNSPYATRFRKV